MATLDDMADEIDAKDVIPPNDTRRVIVFWKNSDGFRCRSIGIYARKYEVEDNDSEVFDERNGTYFLRQGWYEEPWLGDERYPIDGDIVAWQELPGWPDKNNPSPQERLDALKKLFVKLTNSEQIAEVADDGEIIGYCCTNMLMDEIDKVLNE